MQKNRQKIKILFLIDSLHQGGRAMILLNILRYIDRESFEPILVMFKKEGNLENKIPNDIPVLIIDIEKIKAGCFPLFPFILHQLKKIIMKERPLILFCYGWYGATLSSLSNIRSATRPLIVIHEDTVFAECLNHYKGKMKKIFKFLVRFSYNNSDLIIAVSQGVRDSLITHYNVNDEKIKVLYNPVDLKNIINKSKDEVNHPWFNEDIPIIISAGRLVPQKGFDVLIKAFSLVLKKHEARLIILGEGPFKEKLEKLTSQLGIKRYVDFPGFQDNPWRYFVRSTIFVLPSFYEGLPCVIIEALALGVPVISTNCLSGPAEILDGGKYGLLTPVGDEFSMAEGILKVLINNELREEYSKKGQIRVEDFSKEKIIKQYEKVLYNAISSKII